VKTSVDFKLRPWSMDDLPSLVKYANNPKIAKNMSDGFPHPYGNENGKAFIEMATADDPIHIFCIDVEGQAVGGIGIHPQNGVKRKNAELGYWLAEPFWGRGIISEAIVRAVNFAFDTYGIERVFAVPFGHNLASQRVLEKTGFALEARFNKTLFKNGKFEDELVYAVRRENWEKR